MLLSGSASLCAEQGLVPKGFCPPGDTEQGWEVFLTVTAEERPGILLNIL